MAKLVLSVNGETQQEYPLMKERTTIGRKAGNDIQIVNLAVSGKHALVTTILDASFLEDLGSTNGTYVNGKLIKKHALKHGDVIGIGKHELRYIHELAAMPDEELEGAVVFRPEPVHSTVATTQAQAAEETVPTPALLPPPKAPDQMPPISLPLGRLHILTGPIAGRRVDLAKAMVTLGKPGVQVAAISRRLQGYFLTHVEGSHDGQQNYPLVNGDPIGIRTHHLHNHDIIELAGIKMEFTLVS